MLRSLFQPTKDINYDFITSCYVVGSIVWLILYLSHVAQVEALEGYFWIFLPFVPCLIWSLGVRAQWKAELASTSSETSKVDKKD